MKPLLALVLSLAAATPLAAEEVQAVALPSATLAELAARPLAEPGPRSIEHRFLPRFRPMSFRNVPDSGFPASTPSIAPPPVALAFDSGSSTRLSPADASGAVGPNHVVGAYNSGMVVHDRNGALLISLSISQFWASNAGTAVIYDPRIAYDVTHDRWVVMSIFDERQVLIGFSETGDPTGVWRRYAVNLSDADYSQLALTKDTVLIGTNVGFDSPEGVIFSIQKDALYAAPPFLTLQKLQLGIGSDVVPVPSETSTTEYLVVGYGSEVFFSRLEDASQAQSWGIIRSPESWQEPYWALPQLNGGPLDAGYPVIAAAVESGGSIYVAMTRNAPGSTRQSVVWCKFNPLTLQSEWGSVRDPAGTTAYAYPSLAVNRAGAMLIGFGSFSPTTYPSASYVYRDFLGRVSTIGSIRAGTGAYTASERWGDYTSTAVDPTDPNTFWTVQIHSSKGTWVTTWAKIEAPTTPGRRRSVRK